jgi:predicted RNA-binding protein YlqC (UPF0109 family)
MVELLTSIAQGLVNDPSSVQVSADEPNENDITIYRLRVAPDDMGRVIGKQGKIAKAIRSIMRAAAGKNSQKIMVEIEE